MDIKVNGETKSLAESGQLLLDVLRDIDVDVAMQGIAIAINWEVIPRSEWPETKVEAGDELEVIVARQGG